MNFINMASMIMAQQDVKPSADSVGFELAIWKWVVVIAVVAFVIIFFLKRLGDIVAKKKTENMIESVVGKGEAQKNPEWIEEDEEDDQDDSDNDDASLDNSKS
ncbi:MAG: hypothetical protein JXR76_26870 [Deltaproteobacteria bacterium]|nr:hypothetical protein [Deltaproteobacteria bacterium]